jgi:arylsulfatase A-like enzyme
MFSTNPATMNRTAFLCSAILIPLASSFAASGQEDKKPPSRPNIVFVLADDMRSDAMSCAGNPLLKTPNLDRLATEGMLFNNAFVTTSICAVSRASILTGQYARRHGVNDFQKPISDLKATYPGILRASGYHTGFIGKWGVAALNREYLQRSAEAFDFWAGDMDQSAYWHERTCNYITNNGTGDRVNFFCSCPSANRPSGGVVGDKPDPALKDPVHAETEFIPAKIRSFLDQRATDKPFCLSVSLKSPHAPWGGYARRFAQDFEGLAVPRAASVSMDEARRQPKFLQETLESDRGLRLVQCADDLDGERNQWLRQYYRLIQGLDFCMGELLQELDRRGLASNTVVIFTSDNGHFFGEHGFFGKWLMHEESIRVPMIVYDPRVAAAQRGQTCGEMVLNIDVAPTILEAAGLPVPPAMQGQSLLPLLRDPAQPFRDSFFYEHLYGHGPKPPTHIERSEGVRTRDWKYTLYVDQAGPEREELYDMRDDPLEMKNLARDPERQDLLQQLRQQHSQFTADLK